MDRYIGRKLDGRYQVEELIGIGGMANVYKGFDVLENENVAIKILRDEFSSSEDFLRRFKNESKAIALLSHPNIVKVFDVNITEKTQYIVMEHIDGITLKEYMIQKGALDWKDALHFILQILKAIQHAHDMGVVHRDIKPQNIMLLEDGSIKVMDFGIARLSRSKSRTMTDKAIGSVHYISPEQAKGGSVDSRTDIYSVGVILFEMLTGQLPFQADSAVSVAIKQISDNPVKPIDINPDIPEGLEEITLKAMQKSINKRYQTASSMVVDIDEFKKNPSISFEYKYFEDDEPTKYIDAIREVKVNDNGEEGHSKVSFRTLLKSKQTTALMGIALATLIFAIVITIVIVNGGVNDTVTVPDFQNLNIDEIQNNKKYSDFKIRVIDQESKDIEKGIVISQEPSSGRKIEKGSEVKLTVSIGIKKVKVSDLIGKDYQIAESIIKELGLVPEIKYEYNDTVAKGMVIETSPKENSELEVGEKVIIKVSNGLEIKKVTVPDLKGQTSESAKTILTNLNLVLGNITYVDSASKINTIINQEISSGTQVDEKTAINVTMSNGKTNESSITVSVPLSEYKYTDKTVTVEAFVDGIRVKNEDLLIKDVSTWNVSLKGSGSKMLKIMIDGSTFKEYIVDFDNDSVKLR